MFAVGLECVLLVCVCVCWLQWLKRLCLRQVFRDQAIDGETLPLLTEEHLLNTMGLKLGPTLKIRSQVHTPQSSLCVRECVVITQSELCVCFLSVGPQISASVAELVL